MKAAVFYGKNDLRIENKEIPTIGANDVLLKVRACGVCGTDMHIFDGDEGAAPTPKGTTLGHEFAGEIIEVGKNITDLKPGMRACVDPNQLCGTCDACRGGYGHFCENIVGIGTTVDGGFAQYCVVPRSQIYTFSDSLPFTKAAMTEPVACCLHGIDMCDIVPGDTVVIIGGGMIGLLMLQLSKLKGAAKTILLEPQEHKRQMALELGADYVFDPLAQDFNETWEKCNFKRVSTIIECVGKPSTMEQAISLAGQKSTIMLFGLTRPNDTISVKPFEVFKKELTIKASFINPYTQKRALALIENNRINVDKMIGEMIQVDELPSLLADKKRRAQGKTIVVFD